MKNSVYIHSISCYTEQHSAAFFWCIEWHYGMLITLDELELEWSFHVTQTTNQFSTIESTALLSVNECSLQHEM